MIAYDRFRVEFWRDKKGGASGITIVARREGYPGGEMNIANMVGSLWDDDRDVAKFIVSAVNEKIAREHSAS